MAVASDGGWTEGGDFLVENAETHCLIMARRESFLELGIWTKKGVAEDATLKAGGPRLHTIDTY